MDDFGGTNLPQLVALYLRVHGELKQVLPYALENELFTLSPLLVNVLQR